VSALPVGVYDSVIMKLGTYTVSLFVALIEFPPNITLLDALTLLFIPPIIADWKDVMVFPEPTKIPEW
jgi:hypothetical protein